MVATNGMHVVCEPHIPTKVTIPYLTSPKKTDASIHDYEDNKLELFHMRSVPHWARSVIKSLEAYRHYTL